MSATENKLNHHIYLLYIILHLHKSMTTTAALNLFSKSTQLQESESRNWRTCRVDANSPLGRFCLYLLNMEFPPLLMEHSTSMRYERGIKIYISTGKIRVWYKMISCEKVCARQFVIIDYRLFCDTHFPTGGLETKNLLLTYFRLRS